MTSDVFATGHYASGLREKLKRGIELGPKYYLFDVPRYWRQRRQRGLPALDLGALWNPVRSLRHETYTSQPVPPRYEEALRALYDAGVRFDNPPARTAALVAMWWATRITPGDAIECGAYRGATSLLLAVLGKLHDVPQRVLMLDTFAGMPAPSKFDSSRRPGEFTPPPDWPTTIQQQAEALGVADRIEIHRGLFSDTFPAIAAHTPTFSFAHIDANIYQGTLDACVRTLPLMAKGGAVVFDDYNGLMDLGARLAIDEYLRDHHLPAPSPLAECSAYLRM